MQALGNLLGYQTVWLIAVIWAARGNPWPGVAAGILFVSWQLLSSNSPRADGRLVVVALGAGCLIDGVLASGGWVHYSAAAPAFPPHAAPLWILALWGSFSMTLNHSLVYVRDRPWLAIIFGAVGAPLAYFGAQQGWQTIVFQSPAWRGLVWLSCTWASGMLLFSVLASRWITPSPRVA